MSRRHSLGATLFYDEIEAARRRTKAMLLGVWVLLALITLGISTVLGAFYTTEPCDGGVCADGNTTYVTGLHPNTAAVVLSFIIPSVYLLLAWLWSSRAALAITGARPADGAEGAQELLEKVSIAAGIPTPSLWVVDDPAPNAFATGRNERNAHVAVTTGLLERMDRHELEGVLAHEVAHIANRDVQVTTIAVLAAGLITGLAEIAMRVGVHSPRGRKSGQLGLLMIAIAVALYIFAVPAALLLRAGISRSRETLADATAVEITRNPTGLRQALEKLQEDETVVRRAVSATNHLWIESPTDRSSGSSGRLGRLMDTHPPLSERIATLRRIEGLGTAGEG